VNGAVLVDRRVDYLHRLAFQAVGDLLERPALLVLNRALDKLFGRNKINPARLPEGIRRRAATAIPSAC
jgi:hypothetical protein